MLASVILLLGLLPLSDAELTLPFCAPEGGVDSLGFPESVRLSEREKETTVYAPV